MRWRPVRSASAPSDMTLRYYLLPYLEQFQAPVYPRVKNLSDQRTDS